jgi:hypothetical protein
MVVCPICQFEVAALDKTGDADGFYCPLHETFKVASSVFVDANSGKNATREQWEAALKKARAKTKPGEWPVIQTYNF